VLDLGWFGLWLSLSVLGGWMGLRAVGQDLRDRTAAILLYRPLAPSTWVASRLVGMSLVLGALAVAMGGVWAGIALAWGASLSTQWVWAVLLLWSEATVIGAMAGLFSALGSRLFAVGSTGALWVAGHLSAEYGRLTAEAEMAWVSTVVFTGIPDLDRFNVQEALVHDLHISTMTALGVIAYACIWVVLLHALTAIVVSKRDLA
jgi:ABC-type transport system involved in multi-copper enzyme maturation permease subunit